MRPRLLLLAAGVVAVAAGCSPWLRDRTPVRAEPQPILVDVQSQELSPATLERLGPVQPWRGPVEFSLR